MTPEQRLARVAARQHATFTDEQARAAGFTRAMKRTHLRDGSWQSEHHGVFSLAGSPSTLKASMSARNCSSGEGGATGS